LQKYFDQYTGYRVTHRCAVFLLPNYVIEIKIILIHTKVHKSCWLIKQFCDTYINLFARQKSRWILTKVFAVNTEKQRSCMLFRTCCGLVITAKNARHLSAYIQSLLLFNLTNYHCVCLRCDKNASSSKREGLLNMPT
jgi:hypothetical protein